MDIEDDLLVGKYVELMEAAEDKGSRLLGMYYAAWLREFNLPVDQVVLVRLEHPEDSRMYYYFTDMESAQAELEARQGGGNFADV